jgi:hypothetical protein
MAATSFATQTGNGANRSPIISLPRLSNTSACAKRLSNTAEQQATKKGFYTKVQNPFSDNVVSMTVQVSGSKPASFHIDFIVKENLFAIPCPVASRFLSYPSAVASLSYPPAFKLHSDACADFLKRQD